MRSQGIGRRALRTGRRMAVGAARRAARAQAGVVRFQLAQLALGQQVALAALAMQRVTLEVVGDGLRRVGQRWHDRLQRFGEAR